METSNSRGFSCSVGVAAKLLLAARLAGEIPASIKHVNTSVLGRRHIFGVIVIVCLTSPETANGATRSESRQRAFCAAGVSCPC